MTPLGSKGNFRIKKRLKRLAVFALAVFLSFQIAPIVLAQNSSSDNFATSQEDSKKPPKEESAEAKALGELRDLVMDFTVPDFGASDNETESETVDDAENKALSTEAPKLPDNNQNPVGEVLGQDTNPTEPEQTSSTNSSEQDEQIPDSPSIGSASTPDNLLPEENNQQDDETATTSVDTLIPVDANPATTTEATSTPPLEELLETEASSSTSTILSKLNFTKPFFSLSFPENISEPVVFHSSSSADALSDSLSLALPEGNNNQPPVIEGETILYQD